MRDLRPDPEFGAAIIDVDEHRALPVGHRLVQGGFDGTNTRFTLRLPDDYKGRLITLLSGAQGGFELIPALGPLGDMVIAAAAGRGAVLVESNQGFRVGIDPVPDDLTLTAYRATAHTAWFAAGIAAEHYGRSPDHLYVTGHSGGGNRTINVLEHTDIFDGGVSSGLATMEVSMHGWSVLADAEHVLRGVRDDVASNADGGGSGDPLAAARTEQQKASLAALYEAGYPFGNERALFEGLSWLPGWNYLDLVDPTYVQDFFTVPGYAGADGEERRFVGEAAIVDLSPGSLGLFVRLDGENLPSDITGVQLTLLDGPGEGARAIVVHVRDGVAEVTTWPGQDLSGFSVGRRVWVDSGPYAALRHYHRDAPRRSAPLMASNVAYTGELNARLLLLGGADSVVLSETTALYDARVRDRALHRTWWVENMDHLPPMSGADEAFRISHFGLMEQAMDDLIDWVENGVEPAPDVTAHFDEYGILHYDGTARERGGIQPTVTLSTASGRRVEVHRGDCVELHVFAEAPAGSRIVEVAWSPFGDGNWTVEGHDDAQLTSTHRFIPEAEGTLRPVVRVRSRRDGSDWLVENLSSAQVVVR